MAQIVDATVDDQGRIRFISDAYRILADPGVRREDLRRIAEIARRAQAGEIAPAAAVA
jgi:hypothetical protein